MIRRRSFLSAEDVDGVRKLRTYGELMLWRSRVASGERRLALLEGARAAFACAAAVVRRARLTILGQGSRNVEVRAATRMQAAAARLKRSWCPVGGPDA